MEESSRQSGARFSLEIDKRIIDGVLGDRETMLRELAEAGFSKKAVLDRASSLGLTRAFISRCQVGAVSAQVRRCLRCEERFVSLGPQNRLCRRCVAKK